MSSSTKSINGRLTANSRAIINAIASSSGPISALEIVKSISSANKATIYRQLQKLESLGYLHSFVSTIDNNTYYELESDHIAHFECSNCGSISCLDEKFDLVDSKSKTVIQSEVISKQSSMGRITRINIEGICLACLSPAKT